MSIDFGVMSQLFLLSTNPKLQTHNNLTDNMYHHIVESFLKEINEIQDWISNPTKSHQVV